MSGFGQGKQQYLPFILVVFLIVLLSCIPLISRAQVFNQTLGAHLEITPKNPEPYSEITVKLNDFGLHVLGATVRWFIDNVEVLDAREKREITLITKGLGESTRVSAVVSSESKAPITITETIVPSNLDIMVESDTYVPSFYKGRALPAQLAGARAIAVVDLGGTDTSDLFYTWRIGNQFLNNGATKNLSSVTFEVPRFEKPLLSVSVTNAAGNVLASKTILLERTTPEIHFYLYNPLRGIHELAVSDSQTLIGEELVLRAEPYFVSTSLIKNPEALSWRFNGVGIENPTGDPQALTLRATGERSRADIAFAVANREALSQNVQNEVTIFLENQ